MKYFLTLFTLFIFSLSFSQKSKTIEIARVNSATIKASIKFNAEDAPIDTTYFLMARDNQYEQLIEFIFIFNGEIKELHTFLRYALDFYNKEDPGTSTTYNGHLINISKSMGMKLMSIYELDEDGNGYTYFNESMLKKLILKTEEWSNSNKVSLK